MTDPKAPASPLVEPMALIPASVEPKSCQWEGRHFGAHYPDATCIDGWLWDLDSCDEPGGSLTSGGDIPCPLCNTVEYLDYINTTLSGNASQRRCARRRLIVKIRAQAVKEMNRYA